MTDRELLQQALDALNKFDSGKRNHGMLWQVPVIETIKARLAQPEPEPVATLFGSLPVYDTLMPCQTCEALARAVMLDQVYHENVTTQREWQSLTDDEMFRLWVKSPAETEARFAFARAIEAKLKEKNNG